MKIGQMLFAVMVQGRWRPGIGDPTVLGWATVVAYLVAAIACGLAARREPMPDGSRRAPREPSRFWLVLAGLMLALGINKQLDLQSWVTQVGRDFVRARGLYSERRELQLVFIAAVALACVVALAGIFWASRRTLRQRWPAIAGMLFVLGFVVIRAASFHHVDAFLAATLGGLRWNWILELGGVAAVTAAAARVLLAPPGHPARPEGAATYRYKAETRRP